MYRYHEYYSASIRELAVTLDIPLIDVRTPYLVRRDFSDLVSMDGIHPSLAGYDLMFGGIRAFLEQHREDIERLRG